jgi:flagellar protein FliL
MAEETQAEAPKKSKKKLMIIVLALVVVLGGGAGAYLMFFSGSKAEAAPAKGVVATLENALTINLADAHYLKLGFAIQETTDGPAELDLAEAQDIAIEVYTGQTVATLSTEQGRAAAKADFLKKLEKAYDTDGTKAIMDVYFTAFVTQ